MQNNHVEEITPLRLGEQNILLKSDLAAEFPLYLYLNEDNQSLLYSKSITSLLNDPRVRKPLKVSYEGVSFLLQSSVVPPPKTAYENLFIVGIGDTATVSNHNGKIKLSFNHEFPFFNTNRFKDSDMQPDEDLILEMLAEATVSRIDPSKPSFLFHSAGKDSNSIALALAEAGWQDRVTLITHKSKGIKDESEISKKIAKQLGFQHVVLHEVDKLEGEYKQAIEECFSKVPFPCVDNVTLAYPLYAYQMPELKGANLIDGMGNDVFIGHLPKRREYQLQQLSGYVNWIRPITKYATSTSLIHLVGRTRSEWTGMSGLSYSDAKLLSQKFVDVSSYWKQIDIITSDLDYFDFRGFIRGTNASLERMARKVRNFADSINANLVLPWANEKLANYFGTMPESYLFDRKSFKNKLILRKMLKHHLGLDSDALGKMGFSYDSKSVVEQNWEWIQVEINRCTLWNKQAANQLIMKLKKRMTRKDWGAGFASRLIYRIFLISMWFNYSCHLQGSARSL